MEAARENLVTLLVYRAGRLRRARLELARLRSELERRPNDWELRNDLAWLLATCSDDSVRNGAEAVSLAQKLLERTGPKNAPALRTLAAALAEKGDFAEALNAARMARNATAGNQRLGQQIERMIASFEKGEPFTRPNSLPATPP